MLLEQWTTRLVGCAPQPSSTHLLLCLKSLRMQDHIHRLPSARWSSLLSCRAAAVLYLLRCLPPLFAPSGLFGAVLVFVAGGIATILLLITAGVCRCVPL